MCTHQVPWKSKFLSTILMGIQKIRKSFSIESKHLLLNCVKVYNHYYYYKCVTKIWTVWTSIKEDTASCQLTLGDINLWIFWSPLKVWMVFYRKKSPFWMFSSNTITKLLHCVVNFINKFYELGMSVSAITFNVLLRAKEAHLQWQ